MLFLYDPFINVRSITYPPNNVSIRPRGPKLYATLVRRAHSVYLLGLATAKSLNPLNGDATQRASLYNKLGSFFLWSWSSSLGSVLFGPRLRLYPARIAGVPWFWGWGYFRMVQSFCDYFSV